MAVPTNADAASTFLRRGKRIYGEQMRGVEPKTVRECLLLLLRSESRLRLGNCKQACIALGLHCCS